MKFSHIILEQIRQNPKGAKEILSADGGGRLSMNRVWFFAARKYHQSGNDRDYAFNYFENMFDSRFVSNSTNRQRKVELLNKLDNYIKDYQTQGFEFYDYSIRISVDIRYGNMIGGEIFRYDRVGESGYAITLLDKEDSLWAKELRYPLFQIHFSNLFQCPADNIKVGIYNFEKEVHEYISFDEATLKQTEIEVLHISNELNKIQL